jgi:hypothetical protein
MLPFNALGTVAGQLLGIAFAAGLNLYATVAVLGTAARVGLIPPLPPGLRGLSNGAVIGSAAALFLAELVIEKLPVVGAFWAGVHTIIRPLATAFLTFLAFAGVPPELRVGFAAASGLLAFAAHGGKTGLRVMLASARRPRGFLYIAAAALALDCIAIAIAVAALLYPAAAWLVGATVMLLLAAAGPRLWRAATFGGYALLARLGGFFGGRGWKVGPQLPRHVRRAVGETPLGGREPHGTRATALALPRTPAYRTGWLVFDGRGAAFIFRAGLATRRVSLPPVTGVEVWPGPMADAVRATAAERQGFTLFLLKDGPPAAHTAAELAPPS